MNIVFVKHPASARTFCFAVPDNFVPFVRKGVEVLCDTKSGIQVGTAQTGVIFGDGAKDLAQQNGATFPLKNVVGVASSVNMADIKIPSYLQRSVPSAEKIARRMNELKETGKFKTRIEIIDGELRDGYTAYLVCKMLDMKKLPYIVS